MTKTPTKEEDILQDLHPALPGYLGHLPSSPRRPVKKTKMPIKVEEEVLDESIPPPRGSFKLDAAGESEIKEVVDAVGNAGETGGSIDNVNGTIGLFAEANVPSVAGPGIVIVKEEVDVETEPTVEIAPAGQGAVHDFVNDTAETATADVEMQHEGTLGKKEEDELEADSTGEISPAGQGAAQHFVDSAGTATADIKMQHEVTPVKEEKDELKADATGEIAPAGQGASQDFTHEDIEMDHENTPLSRRSRKRGPPKRYSPDSTVRDNVASSTNPEPEIQAAPVVTPKRSPPKRESTKATGFANHWSFRSSIAMAEAAMLPENMPNPNEPPPGHDGTRESFRRTMELAARALTFPRKDSKPAKASSAQAPPLPGGNSSTYGQDASPDSSEDEIVPERKSKKCKKSSEEQ